MRVVVCMLAVCAVTVVRGLSLDILGILDVLNVTNSNVDPASQQLFEYKESQQIPDLLTSTWGRPIYEKDYTSLNENVLYNQFLLESIEHTVSENVPDRIMFAKGTGAHGYFEVLTDISNITKAKLFGEVGKKTKTLSRLSIALGPKGTSDLSLIAGHGFATKFYTEDGNLDLLTIDSPAFVIRDPTDFATFEHAFKENPQTGIRDLTSVLDFITQNPVVLYTFIRLASDYGLPRGFRHLDTWALHTFELYNEAGESSFVKFKWASDLKYKSFNPVEAAAITSFDPDFFIKDLYNAIKQGNYPSWTLEMDVLNEKNFSRLSFDPIDVTYIWPKGSYKTVQVGRLVMNETVSNHYAEVELAAYNPNNLVPGILEPLDHLFQGRILAYRDAHKHRLGVNRNKILVNCPMYARNYLRNGAPPVWKNGGRAVTYAKNTFNGPVAAVDPARPKTRRVVRETQVIHYNQTRHFYENELSEVQKTLLVTVLAQATIRVDSSLQNRFAALMAKASADLATRYITALNVLKATVLVPAIIEQVDPNKPNPFG